MASENKLLVVIKPHGAFVKPQQKTLAITEPDWEIEWSTASSVPMTVDFFNITVGRITQDSDQPRKVEEYWRITHVPGHARKLTYGVNPPDATSTQAKPLVAGVYAIKITGMSAITEGLHVEAGMGAVVVKLTRDKTSAEDAPVRSENTSASPISRIHTDSAPVRIVNEAVLKFFSLSDEDETGGDSGKSRSSP